jgi:hypothetical protein
LACDQYNTLNAIKYTWTHDTWEDTCVSFAPKQNKGRPLSSQTIAGCNNQIINPITVPILSEAKLFTKVAIRFPTTNPKTEAYDVIQ